MAQWKRVLVATGGTNAAKLKPSDLHLEGVTTNNADWSAFQPTADTSWDGTNHAGNTDASVPVTNGTEADKYAALGGKNTLKIIAHSTDGGGNDLPVLRFWQDQTWSDDGYGTEYAPTWPGAPSLGWYGVQGETTGSTGGGRGVDIHDSYGNHSPLAVSLTGGWGGSADDGATTDANSFRDPYVSSTAVYTGNLGTTPSGNLNETGFWATAAAPTVPLTSAPADAEPATISAFTFGMTEGTGTHNGSDVTNGLLDTLTGGISTRNLSLTAMKVQNSGANIIWTDANGDTQTMENNALWRGNSCATNGPEGSDQSAFCGPSIQANHYKHPTVNGWNENHTFGVGGDIANADTWNADKHVLNNISITSNVDIKGHVQAASSPTSAGRTLDILDLYTGYESHLKGWDGGVCSPDSGTTVSTLPIDKTEKGCCVNHGNSWDDATVSCDWSNAEDDYIWYNATQFTPQGYNDANPGDTTGSCYGGQGTNGDTNLIGCDAYHQWLFQSFNGETNNGTTLVTNENMKGGLSLGVDFSSDLWTHTMDFVQGATDPVNGDFNITVTESTGGVLRMKIEAPGPEDSGWDAGAGGDFEGGDGFGSGGVIRYIEAGDGLVSAAAGQEYSGGEMQGTDQGNSITLSLAEPGTLTTTSLNDYDADTNGHSHLVTTTDTASGNTYTTADVDTILKGNNTAGGAITGGISVETMIIEEDLISDTAQTGALDLLSTTNAYFADAHIQLNTVLDALGGTRAYGTSIPAFEMGVGTADGSGGTTGSGNTLRESGIITLLHGANFGDLEDGQGMPQGGRSYFHFKDNGGNGNEDAFHNKAFGGCTAGGWGGGTTGVDETYTSYPGRCLDGDDVTSGVEDIMISKHGGTLDVMYLSPNNWFTANKDLDNMGSIATNRHQNYNPGSPTPKTDGHIAAESVQQGGHILIGSAGRRQNFYKGNSYANLPTLLSGGDVQDGVFLYSQETTNAGLNRGLYIYKDTGGGGGDGQENTP